MLIGASCSGFGQLSVPRQVLVPCIFDVRLSVGGLSFETHTSFYFRL